MIKQWFDAYLHGELPNTELKGKIIYEMGFLPDSNWMYDFLQHTYNSKNTTILWSVAKTWYVYNPKKKQ